MKPRGGGGGGVSIPTAKDERVVEANLFGEGEWKCDSADGEAVLKFDRGVANYPLPQQTLYLTPKPELRFIYGHTESAAIRLGEHVGSGGAPCLADLNELLGKHTAILGSTGAGKSAAVAAILHSILERGAEEEYKTWHPRIVILDPHNEYRSAFPSSRVLSTEDGTLQLPYWLLNFQETLALLIGKTEFVATSQANIVKRALASARKEGASILSLDENAITIDSPIPYSLDTFRNNIESGKPSQPSKQESHDSILQKFDSLRTDARMNFLMSDWEKTEGDPFDSIIGQLIGKDSPLRVVDLAGVPNPESTEGGRRVSVLKRQEGVPVNLG